eukprot:CAMPEP_0198357084 /NCGR_PEP_ID=MMETSP1450-20131203/125413_1 /TAXON_ID=753684 ORGANISM="Madagascaria erythrocladiodes, Strain CCMP3234" /NCGR_SAMPLE_ID=MMETSP1450 /ASSEMBLY_ACC=CAM_ASM_001115 /LENGTH=99 /DNA_ID=CAMNT_0044063659 /DNA_START=100 /DNA_END=396 /DNA_ORIENTATION=+
MAIDASKLFRGSIHIMNKFVDPNGSNYRVLLLVVTWIVAIVTSLPGISTAAIIIYLEIDRATLDRTISASAWHFVDIYPETGGEHIWRVRRILGTANVT